MPTMCSDCPSPDPAIRRGSRSGRLAEAEGLDLAGQPVLTSAWANLDGADVRRLGRICVADNCSVGWLSASWNTQLSMVSELGIVNTWDGVMMPSCRAAENVTNLNTDPGSYTDVMARFDDASTAPCDRRWHHVGHGQGCRRCGCS